MSTIYRTSHVRLGVVGQKYATTYLLGSIDTQHHWMVPPDEHLVLDSDADVVECLWELRKRGNIDTCKLHSDAAS